MNLNCECAGAGKCSSCAERLIDAGDFARSAKRDDELIAALIARDERKRKEEAK